MSRFMGAAVFGLWALGSTLGGALLGGACATVTTQSPAVPRDGAPWWIVHLPRAQQRLQEHGLAVRTERIAIVAHDDPAAFLAATGQREPLLRAWTTHERIHLLDPRHWRDDSPATRTERLTHELCHAALLQYFPDEAAARAARLPRFFTEGACSVVARQERLPLAEVLRAAGSSLPLTIEAFATDPEVAYGAAHALAAMLVRDHGAEVFARISEVAARDGLAGCVERALLLHTGAADVPALWRRVVDTQGGGA